MILTPTQRITLHRLIEGLATPAELTPAALRWLRRYGLVDADGDVTEAGRAENARHREVIRQRAARQHRIGFSEGEFMRDRVQRWQAGERPENGPNQPW